MSFCTPFTNFNFRLPQMNFFGCANSFWGSCHSHMPKLPSFGQAFLMGMSFGMNPFFSRMPFGGFHHFIPFNQTSFYYGHSFSNVQPMFQSLPTYSSQSLWSQFKPSTNQVQTVQQYNPSLSWSNFTPSKTTNQSTAVSKTPSTASSTPAFTTYSKSVSGGVDVSYSSLSRENALDKAKNDSRLECLKGGKGWSLAGTFNTDIPYAKKGTSEILTKVAEMVGESLVITSALGTAGTALEKTPHAIGGYVSHHNAENPKLDVDITSKTHGERLAKKLQETGYFSHISIESDHLDVQIDPSKFRKEALSVVA